MEDGRVRYTKMSIKNTLIELLDEKPISKVSVTELCRRAGINRATFYSHYVDIYDLYEKVEEELVARVTEDLGPALSDDCKNTEEVLERFFEFMDENRDICRHFLSNVHDSGFTAKVIGFIEGEFTSQWAHNRSIPESVSKPIFLFAATGSIGILREWLKGNVKLSPAQLSRIIFVLTEKGMSAVDEVAALC